MEKLEGDDESYKLWQIEFEEDEDCAGNNEEDFESFSPQIESSLPSTSESINTPSIYQVNVEEKESKYDSISWHDIIQEASTLTQSRPRDPVTEALRLISTSRRRNGNEIHGKEPATFISPKQRQDAVICLRSAFSASGDETKIRFCPAHSLVLRAFASATLSLGTTCASDVLKAASNLLTESLAGQRENKANLTSTGSPLLSFITESITRLSISAVLRMGSTKDIDDFIESSISPTVPNDYLYQFKDFSKRLERLEWTISCVQKSSFCAHACGPGGLCQSQECNETISGLFSPHIESNASLPLDWADIVCKIPAISIFNPAAGGTRGLPFCFAFYGPASLTLANSIQLQVQQIRKDAAAILSYHMEHVQDLSNSAQGRIVMKKNDPSITLLSIQRWIRKYIPHICLLERLISAFSVDSAAKHLFQFQTIHSRSGKRDDSLLFSSLSFNIAALADAQRWHAIRAIEAACREVDYSALVSSRLMSIRDDDNAQPSQSPNLLSLVLALDEFPVPAPLSAIAMSILMSTMKSYLDEIERFAASKQGSTEALALSTSLPYSQRELPFACRTEKQSILTSTELIISDYLRQVADASAAPTHADASTNDSVNKGGGNHHRIFELSALAIRAELSANKGDVDVYSNESSKWMILFEYAPSFLCIASKTKSGDSTNALIELVQLRENLRLLKVIKRSYVDAIDVKKDSPDTTDMDQSDQESILANTLRTLRFRPLSALFESVMGTSLASCKFIQNSKIDQKTTPDNVVLFQAPVVFVEMPTPIPSSLPPPPLPPPSSSSLSDAPLRPSPPLSPVSHLQTKELRIISQSNSRPKIIQSSSTSSSSTSSTSSTTTTTTTSAISAASSVTRAKPMPGIGYTPLQGTRSSWWDIDAQVEVQKEPKMKGEESSSLQSMAKNADTVGSAFEAILETSREEDDNDEEDEEEEEDDQLEYEKEEDDEELDDDVERVDDKDDEKILVLIKPGLVTTDFKDTAAHENSSTEAFASPKPLPGGPPAEYRDNFVSTSLEAAWAHICNGSNKSEPSHSSSSSSSSLRSLLTTENDGRICPADKVPSNESVRSAIESLFKKGSDFFLEPASVQLERTAGVLILARSSRVSSELSKGLFDPQRGSALQQLWGMRAVCLISDSFTMQPFLDKLFSSLMSPSVSGAQARSSSHLTLWLRQALSHQYIGRSPKSSQSSKASVTWEAPLEHEKIHAINSSLFSVSIGAFSADSADEMISKGGIQIVYGADNNKATLSGEQSEAFFAVSRLLFSNANMEVYNASFSALLRLKRLLWTLNLLSESCNETDRALNEASEAATDLGRSYLIERNEQMQRKKRIADPASAEASVELLKYMPRVHAHRRATLHFISTLYNHSVLNAVLEPWKTFVSRIETDPSLPSVKAAHSLYLKAVANACHAHHTVSATSSLTAAAALSKLLTRVDAFAALCVDFCNVAVAISHGRSSSRTTALRLLGAIETSAASLPRQIALCTHAAASMTASGSGGDDASFLSCLTASLDANRYYEKLLKKN